MSRDNILYHYCPNDSLIKILQSKEIHFVSLEHSNDPLEVVEAKQHFYDLVLKDLNREPPNLDGVQSQYFSLSLSRSKDKLSQWRGYADDCKGVMLAICMDRLKYHSYLEDVYEGNKHIYNGTHWGTPCFRHEKVIYGRDDLIEKTFTHHSSNKNHRNN